MFVISKFAIVSCLLSCRRIHRVIVLVISNPTNAQCESDLKLRARLLPELYSTRYNYYYLFYNTSCITNTK